MSAAPPRITLKSLDYFKYRKLIVDGNREDYAACDKDVRAACDDVQTLHFRDEEFDDGTDRARLADVFSVYRRLVAAKRLDATDVKVKSGWWGDQRNAYSAGKIKAQALRANLIEKAQNWSARQEFFTGGEGVVSSSTPDSIDGPGVYVFRHKDRQCFQEVCRADNVFARCAERLRAAFDATTFDPLGVLLVITMATDWDFYFEPVESVDNDDVLRICENDLILKHDSIWPRGLNHELHLTNIVCISEFRRSCVRHRWPPADGCDGPSDVTIDTRRVKAQLDAHSTALTLADQKKKLTSNIGSVGSRQTDQDRDEPDMSPEDVLDDAPPPQDPTGTYVCIPAAVANNGRSTPTLGTSSSAAAAATADGVKASAVTSFATTAARTRNTPTPSTLNVKRVGSGVQSPRPHSAPRPASSSSTTSRSVDVSSSSRTAAVTSKPKSATGRGGGGGGGGPHSQQQAGAASSSRSHNASRTSSIGSSTPENGHAVPSSPARRSAAAHGATANVKAAARPTTPRSGAAATGGRSGIARPSSGKAVK